MQEVFAGTQGEIRKNQCFRLVRDGLCMFEGFAGRQGTCMAVCTLLTDMQTCGAQTEGFLHWRVTEKSDEKRKLIKTGNLKPQCAYTTEEAIGLTKEDYDFIQANSPAEGAPAKAWEQFHNDLEAYFAANEANIPVTSERCEIHPGCSCELFFEDPRSLGLATFP
jgi:hypothetical protein